MSDAVMKEPFLFPASSATDDIRDADLQDKKRRLIQAWAARESIETWQVSELKHQMVPVSMAGAIPRHFTRSSLPAGSFLVERDDNGDLIVGDPVGAAYGLGASFAEAVQQWEELARQHYEDIRREADSLHPRMTNQLRFLEQFFG